MSQKNGREKECNTREKLLELEITVGLKGR